ncbi:MAG: hypothetical protein IKR45_02965 [Treponema sp.]|jgi:hypothetical protein|nr:hypothetical protein [Treponema sp.]
MDIKGFFEKVKEKIVSLYQLIADYCHDNKRNAILFASLGACILLLLILLICLPKGKKKDKAEAPREIVLTQDLLIPNGPEFDKDYNISRQTKDKWTDEQTEEWFVIPTEKDIQSLEKANDNIVSDITGAAP